MPYVRHKAEFYFRPDFSWSISEASDLYNNSQQPDWIRYEDCIEGMAQMDPESVDLIVADPPFGIQYSGTESCYNRNADNVVPNYVDVTDYTRFSNEWIPAAKRILKRDGNMFIISGYSNLSKIEHAAHNARLRMRNHIVWRYPFGLFTTRKFVSSHYHILFYAKRANPFFNRINHYVEDIWTDISRKYLPNQLKNGNALPPALVQRLIDYTTRPGEVVFDPFMGNGTTAITCIRNFRHYQGFEINADMQPIIEHNIGLCTLGSDYIPYNDRIPTAEELSQIDDEYARAYKIYLQEQNN